MGYLLTAFGGWHSQIGYTWCFLLMSVCALVGVALQLTLSYILKREKLQLEGFS